MHSPVETLTGSLTRSFITGDLISSLVLLAVIITPWVLVGAARIYARRMLAKYSRISSAGGTAASDAARRMLDGRGLPNVLPQMDEEKQTDRFDPEYNLLQLSKSTYESDTLGALSVTAHEAGHAVQYNRFRVPRAFTDALPKVFRIEALVFLAAVILFKFIGFPAGIWISVLVVAVTGTIAQLALLAIDLNASRIGLEMLKENGILSDGEITHVRRVLIAAAAASVISVLVMMVSFGRMQSRGGQRTAI